MSTALHADCDAAAARMAPPDAPVARPDLVLATTVLASGLAFIDGSVVNVGLPAIGRSLAADPAVLQWIVNAYLLPLSALLLLGGSAGDRFGRRRLLIVGIIIFGLATIACSIAPSLTILLAGRFFQGVGAAFLMPNSLAILGSTFTGEAKGRAIGIWAAAGAVMGAIGPVLGGWLIDLGSWRAIFLINLPLAGLAILLAAISIRPDLTDRTESLDWTGGVLATLGLGGLTWALTLNSRPGSSAREGIVAGVVACALLAAFVIVEHRRGSRAMMPLKLFASRSFIGLTLLTLLLYGALGALLVLLPYVLIEFAGYSGTAAGAALLPVPLMLTLTSPIVGRLSAKVGARLPLGLGSLFVGIGFAVLLKLDASADYWTRVLPAIVVIALGLSGAVAPLTTAVLKSVDAAHTGSASGFNSAIARTGGLIATALLGPVLAAHGPALLTSFHGAMISCVAACGLAALSALVLVDDGAGPRDPAGNAPAVLPD